MDVVAKIDMFDIRIMWGKDKMKEIKDLFCGVEEFNDMTPKEAIDYLSRYLMDIDCDDERCSDAIKRLQMLVNDLMQ